MHADGRASWNQRQPVVRFGGYADQMELDGTLEANLVAAIRSARRLRGHPVYADTLSYWTDLLRQARRELPTTSHADSVTQLVIDLETELAERAS